MRIMTFIVAGFALSALAISPVRAADYKFSTTISAPDVKVSTITASASEKIKNEKIRWDSNDIEYLKKALIKRVTDRLGSSNLMSDSGARLELILVDITPNRPTMHEMSERIGLNLVSFGLGGAEIEAHLIGADGSDLGKMHYRYFSSQLDQFSSGVTTWYDARRAFDKFSRRLAKELAIQPES